MQSSATHSTVKGEEVVCFGEEILSVDRKTISSSDLLVERDDHRLFIQFLKKSVAASSQQGLPAQSRIY